MDAKITELISTLTEQAGAEMMNRINQIDTVLGSKVDQMMLQIDQNSEMITNNSFLKWADSQAQIKISLITADTQLAYDWVVFLQTYQWFNFISWEAVEKILDHFRNKWITPENKSKERVAQFCDFKHKSCLTLEAMYWIKRFADKATSNLYSNETMKKQICKHLYVLEIFNFNTENLIIAEKDGHIKKIMDLLLVFNQTRKELDEFQESMSKTLLEKMLCAVSVVLRSQSAVAQLLNQNKQYLPALLTHFQTYKKDDRILKPTIMIVRLLLCDEGSVAEFQRQF